MGTGYRYTIKTLWGLAKSKELGLTEEELHLLTGWQVLSFEYRLAPEHPYPAAVEDAVKAWDYLMYQGYGARDVVVAGDSAGGNLALVLTHLLKEAGRRLPRALILLSPWTDMTASGKSYQERAAIDLMPNSSNRSFRYIMPKVPENKGIS